MLGVVLNKLNDCSTQKRHLVNTFGRPDPLPPKQPAESGRKERDAGQREEGRDSERSREEEVSMAGARGV